MKNFKLKYIMYEEMLLLIVNENIENKELIKTLKTNRNTNLNFINRLKFFYRVYICPFSRLLPLVSKNDNLVDIGCGSGLFIFLLKKHVKPNNILGLEISEDLVKTCEDTIKSNELENVEVRKYDGFKFPDCISEYNVFSMIDILHHIPYNLQPNYLENLFNSMKKGDTLILKDIDARSKFAIFNKIHDLIFSSQIPHERAAEDVKRICEKLGFSILSYEKNRMFVYPHFYLILKK